MACATRQEECGQLRLLAKRHGKSPLSGRMMVWWTDRDPIGQHVHTYICSDEQLQPWTGMSTYEQALVAVNTHDDHDWVDHDS